MGVAVNTVRQMPDQQAKTLQGDMIGGAAGLLVGYAVGYLGNDSGIHVYCV